MKLLRRYGSGTISTFLKPSSSKGIAAADRILAPLATGIGPFDSELRCDLHGLGDTRKARPTLTCSGREKSRANPRLISLKLRGPSDAASNRGLRLPKVKRSTTRAQ